MKDMPKTNRQRNFIAAAGISAAMALLVASAAASASDRFPISIADVETRMAERISKADEDANGSIDLQEFMNATFDRKAGGHHRRGAKHMRKMRAQPTDEQRAAIQANAFALLDSDADGNISEAEFNQADGREVRKQARKQAMFSQLDADGNGLLSSDELPNPAARLRSADTDGDGLVTREEMRSARQNGNFAGHRTREG